ncbi:MAG: phytase [Pseudomonadota bacterium]
MSICVQTARGGVLAFFIALSCACASKLEIADSAMDEEWAIAVEHARFVQEFSDGNTAPVLVAGSKGLALTVGSRPDSKSLVGRFGAADYRVDNNVIWVAALDKSRQKPMLTRFDSALEQWLEPTYFGSDGLPVEGLCLYRESDHLHAFLLGEDGQGEQWSLADLTSGVILPRYVRSLGLPPAAEFCTVDDQNRRMYVSESTVGVWQYDAHSESELNRTLIGSVSPSGSLGDEVAGVSLFEGSLWVVDSGTATVRQMDEHAGVWSVSSLFSIRNAEEPLYISAHSTTDGTDWLISLDEGLAKATTSHIRTIGNPLQQQVAELPVVLPSVETDAVPGLGDAADDPAIWTHPDDPAKSLVLATDKKWGLVVFDLDGRIVQSLEVGRLNNVDVRPGFRLGESRIDIAVATHRDLPGLIAFGINPEGLVSVLSEVPMPVSDAYGVCLFVDRSGTFYAIANDKDGSFLQYELAAPEGKFEARLARRFSVASQPEGCVAHDEREVLFVGEEGMGVWRLDARASAPANLELVAGVGQELVADVEGLAIYHTDNTDYLVVSSQGNDSFVLIESTRPYAVRGNFRVGGVFDKGIDAVSETDGLDVTSASLGTQFPAGILVVQDGRNRMPAERQNFKFVSWAAVAEVIGIE